MNVTDTEFLTDTRVCPQGLIFPLLDESGWNPVGRAVLYFLALLYAFIGVSVVTDIFMGAVVTITSKTKKVYLAKYKVRKVNHFLIYELGIDTGFVSSQKFVARVEAQNFYLPN